MSGLSGSSAAADVLNLVSVLFNVGAVVQDRVLHRESVRRAQEQHMEQVNTERMCNLQSLETDLKAQIQSLGTDLTLAGKEADRDMWEQRNTQFQTLMLAATVMFGGGLGVIVQGALPQREGLPEIYVILYSTSLALGFGMLFISIIVSMAIMKRMCKYMYNRARNHRVNFGSILDRAMAMVQTLDDQKRQEDNYLGDLKVPYSAGRAETVVGEYDEFIRRMIDQINRSKEQENLHLREREARRTSDATASANRPWARWLPLHSKKKAAEGPTAAPTAAGEGGAGGPTPAGAAAAAAAVGVTPPGASASTSPNAGSGRNGYSSNMALISTMSFPDFWDLYCKNSASVATNNFYAGTLALLLAVATMTFSQLAYNYGSFICAGLFAGICFLAASVALYFHVQHSSTWNLSVPRDFQLRAYLTRQLSNSDASNGDGRESGMGFGSGAAGRFTAGLRRASSFNFPSRGGGTAKDDDGNGNGDGDEAASPSRGMRRWSSLSSAGSGSLGTWGRRGAGAGGGWRGGRKGAPGGVGTVVGIETLERERERRRRSAQRRRRQRRRQGEGEQGNDEEEKELRMKVAEEEGEEEDEDIDLEMGRAGSIDG